MSTKKKNATTTTTATTTARTVVRKLTQTEIKLVQERALIALADKAGAEIKKREEAIRSTSKAAISSAVKTAVKLNRKLLDGLADALAKDSSVRDNGSIRLDCYGMNTMKYLASQLGELGEVRFPYNRDYETITVAHGKHLRRIVVLKEKAATYAAIAREIDEMRIELALGADARSVLNSIESKIAAL